MDLSKRLKDFCRVRGTNRTALEKKLNLGNGTIGKWWKNGRVPNYANLLAVANELETTVAYLSGETDDPEIKKAPDPKTGGVSDDELRDLVRKTNDRDVLLMVLDEVNKKLQELR